MWILSALHDLGSLYRKAEGSNGSDGLQASNNPIERHR